MKTNTKYSLIFLILMLNMFFVIAQPPLNTVILDRGVDIIKTENSYFYFGEDVEVNFWTYNSTNGQTLTNNSLNCTYYLFNDSGYNFLKYSNIQNGEEFINYGKGSPLCINCWNLIISKDKLTVGDYTYKIKCQGTSQGGYLTGEFKVIERLPKQLLTINNNYTFILIVIFIIIGVALFFTEYYFVGSLLIVASGLFILFSKINILIGVIITIIGLLMSMSKK